MTCADPIVAFGIGDTADEADGARVLVVYNDAVPDGGQYANRHCSWCEFAVPATTAGALEGRLARPDQPVDRANSKLRSGRFKRLSFACV